MSDSKATARSRMMEMGAVAHGLTALEVFYDEILDGDDPIALAQQVTLLKGAIWWSTESLIEELFEDITALETGTWAGTQVISRLPEQYGHQYDVAFARKLTVAAVTLTNGITSPWVLPGCFAQELLMGLLIEDLGDLAELFELDFPGDYESAIVEHLMWGDTDYRYAYRMEADGIWSDKSLGLGMANMDLSAWFRPFDEGRDRLHPYLLS